jgi:two-component system, OmpR family, response regulator MprA
MTREVIFARVWGYDLDTGSNAIEVNISYLRRNLEADGEGRVIHTVRGMGYVLRAG